MKKVLCHFLACLLLAGAVLCAGSDTQFGFGPPIKGITWGMNYDAAAKQLNLQKNDALYDKSYSGSLVYKNAAIFGQKATVYLSFDEKGGIGLEGMYVNIPKMDMETIWKKMDSIYGKERIAYEWDNIKISDLPQNIQDRYKYLKVEVPKKESAGKINPDWADYKDWPLARFSIQDSNTLVFSATEMAAYQLISNDTAYNQYVNRISTLIKKSKAKSK